MAVLVDLQRVVWPRGLPAAAALLHQPPPAVRRPRLPGQRPRPRTLRGAQAMSCALLMVNFLLKSCFLLQPFLHLFQGMKEPVLFHLT